MFVLIACKNHYIAPTLHFMPFGLMFGKNVYEDVGVATV